MNKYLVLAIGMILLSSGFIDAKLKIDEDNTKSEAKVDEIKGNNSVVTKALNGTTHIILPVNQKFESITWKENQRWILYRPMKDDEEAVDHVCQGNSRLDLGNNTLIIHEVKEK